MFESLFGKPLWERLNACLCGTTYGPCQRCMNYSDICEQLLRNHFCLPERGKKHQAHWALFVPHRGSLQTLLMPWVPFCICPFVLDHTGSHRCRLGYFPFDHGAFFSVLVKLPFMVWWKCWRERLLTVGLCYAGKCRHPLQLFFL